MGKVRVEVNRKGVTEVLNSSDVRADLSQRAHAIAAAADANAGHGAQHKVETETGKRRARAAVITANASAMRAQATRHTLTAAIDAGR